MTTSSPLTNHVESACRFSSRTAFSALKCRRKIVRTLNPFAIATGRHVYRLESRQAAEVDEDILIGHRCRTVRIHLHHRTANGVPHGIVEYDKQHRETMLRRRIISCDEIGEIPTRRDRTQRPDTYLHPTSQSSPSASLCQRRPSIHVSPDGTAATPSIHST